MRRKAIFDPIHGQITLSGAPLELISHPAFQRLWGIRQTGFAHLVFPGANHTRLEHPLGVYWVAQAMAAALGLSTTETELVTSGGLLCAESGSRALLAYVGTDDARGAGLRS